MAGTQTTPSPRPAGGANDRRTGRAGSKLLREPDTYFLKAIAITPNDHAALYNIDSNLGRSGHYAEALPYLRRSVDLSLVKP